MTTSQSLKVYYDGSCRVCAREMAAYREEDTQGVLEFIDISAPRFEPHLHGGSREEFMARLHVRDGAGRFHTGVDAFAAIWTALPGARLSRLARLVQFPGVHLLASFGYEVFARLRTWLPKNQRDCDDGHCHWGHPHPRA